MGRHLLIILIVSCFRLTSIGQENLERCYDVLDSLYANFDEERAVKDQLVELSSRYPSCDIIDLELAIDAYDRADTTEALQFIDNYVTHSPDDPERLLQRASMLIDFGKTDQANNDLDRLRKITQTDTAYRLELVAFQYEIGNYELAKELLKPLEKDSLWRHWYLIETARILERQQKFKEAYKVALQVTEEYPWFCDGWYLKGKLMYYVWGIDTQPVEDLFRALDLCDDAMAIKCLSLLADLFEEFEDYEKALGAHDQILELAPYDPDALYNAATFKSSMGMYEECVIDMETYLDVVGEDLNARFELAYCMTGAELLPEAVEEFTYVLKQDSSDIDVWYNRAVAYTRMGEFNDAIRDYTKVLELNPTMFDALFNRGLVYHQKGEFKKAVQDFTEYLIENPNDAEALLNRGYAKYYGDDPAGACGDWDRMKLIEPELYEDVEVFCKDK